MRCDRVTDKKVIETWEERFHAPPPPGSNFRDCKCARIEAKASVHHPLWVVVVYEIDLPKTLLRSAEVIEARGARVEGR